MWKHQTEERNSEARLQAPRHPRGVWAHQKIKREQNKEKNPWLPQSINAKPLFGQHKESELDQKIAEILFEKPDHDKDDLDSQMTVTDHDQDERDF